MPITPLVFALLYCSGSEAKPIWEKYQKKDWVGCQADQLQMNSYDDSYCFRQANQSSPVTNHQFKQLTGGRCISMGRWSYKG